MSELLTLAERLKEIGSSALIVGAALWFAFKYLPDYTRRQGELNEILKNNSVVISNCTTVLKMVAVKDEAVKESLERIEKRVDEINLSVHDIRNDQKHQRRE